MLTFRFQEDPTAEVLRSLVSKTDWPCVWSETFLRSSAPAGSRIVAFTVERAGLVVAVALATRTSKLLHRQLVFPSYPRWIEAESAVSGKFWQGLREYCAKFRISGVIVNSFEAPASLDVPLEAAAQVHERQEYYVDLRPDLDALFKGFSSNHRRNIKRAAQQHVVCSIDRSEEAFERHVAVFSHTQARREARSESAAGINTTLCRRLLKSKDGFLMQLRLEDEVVSSFLILLTPKRAFYYSGGTTEHGMRMGASHYLMWLAIMELKTRGVFTLSLGGISGADPAGLARYKNGFGATAVPLANFRYDMATGYAETFRRAAQHVRNAFARGVRKWPRIVRFDRWLLYSWTPEVARETALPAGYELRGLLAEDFAEMVNCGGRLADQARLYYFQRGIASAYGLFFEGQLVHISWVYTSMEYAREPLEQIRLGHKDAEITNCFTLDAFRGQGLYAMAIRVISERLFEQGVQRVFMKTTADNIASQKGITNAGLQLSGTMYHLSLPAVPAWKGWYFSRPR